MIRRPAEIGKINKRKVLGDLWRPQIGIRVCGESAEHTKPTFEHITILVLVMVDEIQDLNG